jgi:hypothetical protein
VPADTPCATPSGVTTLFPDYAYTIALHGGNAYLATIKGVLQVPIAGGPATALASGGEAFTLTLDAKDAYYVSSHPAGAANAEGKVSSTTALYQVPLAGGASQILVDGAWGTIMATDGTWLWWGGSQLQGVRLGQSTPVPIRFPLEAGALVEAIAVGSDSLFLAVYAITSGGPGVGSIRRAKKDGSSVTTIVAGLQHPTAVGLDDDAVYYNDDGSPSGIIGRADLDGSGQTTLVKVATQSLVVDAHAVYFVTADAIQRVPKTGGSVETIVDGLKTPGNLALDGGNVYWVDGTSVALSDPNPGYAVMTTCK